MLGKIQSHRILVDFFWVQSSLLLAVNLFFRFKLSFSNHSNNHFNSVLMLTKRQEKKLDGNYTRMLLGILNKSWRQHPTRHQLYDHLPPITKIIQVRRTRHVGHCWRSRDELIRDVLLWTTSSNIHPAAMWGYGMWPWRPARGDER